MKIVRARTLLFVYHNVQKYRHPRAECQLSVVILQLLLKLRLSAKAEFSSFHAILVTFGHFLSLWYQYCSIKSNITSKITQSFTFDHSGNLKPTRFDIAVQCAHYSNYFTVLLVYLSPQRMMNNLRVAAMLAEVFCIQRLSVSKGCLLSCPSSHASALDQVTPRSSRSSHLPPPASFLSLLLRCLSPL